MLHFNNIENLENELQDHMDVRINHFEQYLNSLRIGIASPSILDNIIVEAYGTKMKIRDLATILSPDPKLLSIQPYDNSTINSIEKAIQASDVGITPINDGKIIRLPMPEMTEERRKNLVKMVKSKSETCKIEIRNIRRDGNEFAKKKQKENEITEDDLKITLNEIQTITDKAVNKVIDLSNKKETEILKV